MDAELRDPLRLTVLYQDENILVVDKPAGLLVHRTGLDAGERRFALQEARDLAGRHVHAVHRLDKPTSGVLVFALDPDTASHIGRHFASRAVNKQYLAVVRGHTQDEETIDYPLKPRSKDVSGAGPRPPQAAVTRVQTLARVELPAPVGPYRSARYSLVALSPLTGRLHQLRRHMKHRFHPIIGDRKFGDDAHLRFFRGAFDSDRLLLHHASLEMPYPEPGKRVRIVSRPGGTLASVIRALGWGDVLERWWSTGEKGGSM